MTWTLGTRRLNKPARRGSTTSPPRCRDSEATSHQGHWNSDDDHFGYRECRMRSSRFGSHMQTCMIVIDATMASVPICEESEDG